MVTLLDCVRPHEIAGIVSVSFGEVGGSETARQDAPLNEAGHDRRSL